MNYLISAYGIILFIVFGYIIRVNIKCGRAIAEMESTGEDFSKSWIDNSAKRLGLTGAATLLILVALYMAVVWSPGAKGEPVTYRIIYFHVPTAILSYIGFFIAFLGGALFLWKNDLRFDRWAKVGADLGVHFCALMIISGMIWGKQRWGAWWLWEPRLTSAMILLIIFVGYLILRHVIDDPVTRARYAAVYGIIGFIDVPIVHYAIKIWGSIMHPVVSASPDKPGLAPDMALTLKVSMVAFLVTFATIYLIRLRVENLEAGLSRIRSEKEN